MSDKREIAFLCHAYHRGGVTGWMLDAAVAYAADGYTTYFITVDPVKPFHSGKDREKMADLLKARGSRVQLVSAAVNFTFEFGTDEFRASVYCGLVKEYVPEGVPVIVSDDESVWKAAASIADAYPMIGVLHGDQEHYYDKAERYQGQLSVCACVSGRIKRKASERCKHIDPARMFIIPCGIEIPAFAHSLQRNDVCKLIFIGRLSDYEKRAGDLVKIGAAMYNRGISFHMDIIGNSEQDKLAFTQLFNEDDIGRFISFHGWRSKAEIQKLLNSSDMLLLTSNSEGMPLVMMEALASGCGFVGTRVSGIEDYEYHPLAADCVSVFAIGDIEDAVAKIIRIASVRVSRRAGAARTLAETEFSMEACLNKYKRAIASVKRSSTPATTIKTTFSARVYSKVMAIARTVKLSLRGGGA